MGQSSPVLAVVDGVDGVAVVWWVNVGPLVSGMSRLCGAWVLDSADRAHTLQALTATRMTVATVAGQSVLDQQQVSHEEVLDPAATLAAVAAVRDELQTAFEQAAATRKNGRSLIPPSWPTLPEPLDVETVRVPGGDPRTCRALGIARWFDDLCTAWDDVEEQRLTRSYLRSIGGPTTRALPVVIQAVQPSVAG